ncbi:tail fiber assembly protein [Stenotrophomonas maltophilia]|uniref:tail fiber assembly protein n=1 Tax=Stenotrophomonas maltophilia TaxID=40324 RepID=UPI00069D637C|nr:tail fiber assembly protein [Stenotrophomonas maltophilia]MBH1417176.1 phage tail assembly chaperone [Stenotrophomonas maltophilia]MDZ5776483.1 tail fiber assembly protein [Stenotrophomonas maltophilia]HDS1569274.1 phage tail assembly chaperone [Stenotrophomonas maltophilia]HDS1591389.1 phage tail assembly chaperone [Stenotrophomonas maltophilia]
MSAEGYAVSEIGYRAISPGAPLAPGETLMEALPAPLLTRIKAEQMKTERSHRLRASDWTQMADAPITALEKVAYQAYRQALRDLPSLPGFPNVAWPVPPALSDGAASGAEIPVTP